MQNDMNGVNSTTSSNMVSCPRCGEPMKADQRYCMKCGNLNYNHPANQGMKEVLGEETIQQANQIYQMQHSNPDYKVNEKKENNRFCLAFNIVLWALVPVIFYFCFSVPVFVMIGIIVACFVAFFYSYAMQVIYMKAGHDWWSFYIPFYSNYVFFDIALGNGLFFLLTFLPIVGLVVAFVALYQLGKKFGRSGWFTLLLPIISLPLIAYGKSTIGLQGVPLSTTSAKKGGKTQTEIQYARKRFFITIAVLVVIGVIGFYIYKNRSYIHFDLLDKNLIVVKSKSVVKEAKDYMERYDYQCVSSTMDGKLYYPFEDVSSVETKGGMKGYVEIEAIGENQYNYYITITNGKFGVRRMLSKDITVDDVMEMDYIDIRSYTKMICS